ncbi:MAG TPA: hypothetical protein DIC32_00835 [Acinetobacter radioresistens]|uniref:VWA domain-containing protein n=1 Tax=Acinetobacter radioresistens TaxID=40216 RepID=A0A3D3FZJ6_ACIRA|nr:hypothetical protein [Acinetobacter radioresistens]
MSGSKKQTTGHKYFAGFHTVLAQAGCYLRRIWIEEKEAWYGGVGTEGSRISKNNLFGGNDVGGGGGIAGNFNYYIGDKNQSPDSYLESQLGVGNVPAYRGVSSFVWKKGWVGNQAYMKDWKYRVSHINGINSNVTTAPSNFVIAFDCSKSLTASDFLLMKSSLLDILNSFVYFKENYFNTLMNIKLIAFDATIRTLDFINFQTNDVGAMSDFIDSQIQATGPVPAFSNMLGIGYNFFESNSNNSKNTFVILHDGEDVTQSTISLAESKFNTVRHICIYTQRIPENSNADLPYHVALTKMDNTPEDNWFSRTGNDFTDYRVCPTLYVGVDGGAVLNEEAWFGIRTGEPDMNPADMLWLCITDSFWGLGEPESACDKESFLAAWRVLNEEDMYMSVVFDNEGQAQKIIDLICEHIDAVCQVNPKTGLWTLKLVRDDYVEDDLIILNESNVGSISNYEIRTAAEQVNHVTVTYWNKETGKDATTSVHDPARIAMHGVVNKSITYDGFTNEKTAYRAAERDLKALSSPLKVATFDNVDPDIVEGLQPGAAFKWYWNAHGVDGAVMRVSSIDYGDAKNKGVRIEAIEDVFSTPMNSVAPYVPPYVDPGVLPPQDNPTVRVIELDYFDAVQFESESDVNSALLEEPLLSRVAVVAGRPQRNASDADLMTRQLSNYASQGTVEFCPSAELVSAIGYTEGIFAIKNVQDIELIESNKWALLGNEKIAVVSISNTEITVKRGVNGTVPQKHAADSVILFCDDFIALDQNEYLSGETVYVKALTNTSSDTLALSAATEHQIVLSGLMNRPYPPANVKINGEYWPAEIETDLILTWVDRNRVQQTGGEILGWYEGGVTIEPNTQTHLILTQLDENNAELATSNANVTGATSYTMPISTMQADTRFVKITLKTVRDNCECIQPFEYIVELSRFFSAPYDLTVEFKND